MGKSAIVAIIVVIIVVIAITTGAGIAFTFNPESKTSETDDMFDGEDTSEMQAKWDEIEKIKLENYYSEKERQWITSGPFQIDRNEYDLGQKIFLVIEGLKSEEKGQIAFLRQLNDTHYSVYQTIPFDGEKKDAFNYYMQPKLSMTKGLCSAEDIIGNWAVVFKGTDHASITFKITDKIIPNINENYQEPVC